ncbi:hypothetical protein HOS55_gp074 [Pseudomonas phage PMBT3]|uniref:Uncharacterized protein n=1 Tax=Pseudomonas phage PMBT3 TaxID=2059856 RepID=A0A2I6PHZ9_9CAUD|nr:hypothetical protein HOS55_gp074 [Pseudomonas phage PMBT3]AUM59676.1 hypothetical protein [Pseudomonas phage PMBT3]
MILDQRQADDHDKVCLISAMMVSNELEDRMKEGEISRVVVSGLGEFYTIAELALGFIAVMHRQLPDDWDGVVWYERFIDASEGSLADRLVDYLVSWDLVEEDVRQLVIAWLRDSDL